MSNENEYPESTISDDEIEQHYERIEPVIDALAEDSHGNITLGINDFYGWYISEKSENSDEYPFQARPSTLAVDYGDIVDRMDRVLYAVTSYKPCMTLSHWERYYFDDGRVWEESSPLPEYADIASYAVWGDIDLADELKPRRGNLNEETRETVECTLAEYGKEYAKLYGSKDAVMALDSVGGSYYFGSPSATLPIAELFSDDSEAREMVFDELTRRQVDWLNNAQERVESRVDGAADVICPDWCNNRNRQYKTPLSIHKKHDAVVSPIDPFDPDYRLVEFRDVGQELIADGKQWAEELTADDHSDCVAHLIRNLWPEMYDENCDWRLTLVTWVEQKKEEKQKKNNSPTKDLEFDGDLSDLPLTTDLQDVYNSISALDAERVAEKTIVDRWTDQIPGKRDNSGSNKRAFRPTYRYSESGTSCYVDTKKNIFLDTADTNTHGTVVDMALIASENWNVGDISEGKDWIRGVDVLRDLGFEIPVWVPEAGTAKKSGGVYEKTPYWALKKAAVALGVVAEGGFTERENGDGDTYEGFSDLSAYNRTLAALDNRSVEHGRDMSRVSHADVIAAEVFTATDHDEKKKAELAKLSSELRL
ncbi:hypothetical protein [Natronococcus jeotgali]|uniref:hypothetical protein n=1 Tax=Natronococcus jeotgali TaxID=413812 RepID=UPI000A4A0CDE|nr:hypothetical protein [Natronococcus jeotgali]